MRIPFEPSHVSKHAKHEIYTQLINKTQREMFL